MIDTKQPRMMTIRQVAATGILPENAIRTLSRQGKLPAIKVGNTSYINYDLFCLMLENLGNVG